MEVDFGEPGLFGDAKDWGGKLVDQTQSMETRKGFLDIICKTFFTGSAFSQKIFQSSVATQRCD